MRYHAAMIDYEGAMARNMPRDATTPCQHAERSCAIVTRWLAMMFYAGDVITCHIIIGHLLSAHTMPLIDAECAIMLSPPLLILRFTPFRLRRLCHWLITINLLLLRYG